MADIDDMVKALNGLGNDIGSIRKDLTDLSIHMAVLATKMETYPEMEKRMRANEQGIVSLQTQVNVRTGIQVGIAAILSALAGWVGIGR